MQTLAAFFTVVDKYSEASHLAEATLSSKIFNDGKRLASIRRGADVGVRRIELAFMWLSVHWPDNIDWPADVPRPVPSKIPEAAE